MDLSSKLVKYLENFIFDMERDRVIQDRFSVSGLTYLKLRECILNCGMVLEEIPEEQIMIAVIKAGFFRLNRAILAVHFAAGDMENDMEKHMEEGTEGAEILLSGYAGEGLIRQHTVEKAIIRLKKELMTVTG